MALILVTSFVLLLLSGGLDSSENTLEICEKFLQGYYKDKPDNWLRILFFLQREANEFQGDTPVRNFLASLIKKGDTSILDNYMKNLVDDTRKASNDETFRRLIHDLYYSFNHAGSEPLLSESWLAKVQSNAFNSIEKSMNSPESYLSMFSHMTNALTRVPKESWPLVLKKLAAVDLAQTGALRNVAQGSMKVIDKMGTKVAVASLVAAQLSWEAMKNMYLWWKGEITGKRCAKNMVDALGSIGGGVTGSLGGAAFGTAAGGPIGGIAGGIAGGIGGAFFAGQLAQFCSEWFFDLPKTVALEKAYAYLDVHHSADNSVINSAYRKLALKYHPDKGGSQEQWIDLQISLQTIRLAREEVY